MTTSLRIRRRPYVRWIKACCNCRFPGEESMKYNPHQNQETTDATAALLDLTGTAVDPGCIWELGKSQSPLRWPLGIRSKFENALLQMQLKMCSQREAEGAHLRAMHLCCIKLSQKRCSLISFQTHVLLRNTLKEMEMLWSGSVIIRQYCSSCVEIL